MKKIKFIGNTQSNYASRWRREGYSNQVEWGKYLGRKYFSNENITPDELSYAINRRNQLKENATKDRAKRKINKELITGYSNRDDRIYKKDSVSISDTGKEKLEKLKARYSERQQVALKKKKLTKLIKKGKKAALIGAGIGTLGYLGYKLARKLRKDKGKKRGSYNR